MRTNGGERIPAWIKGLAALFFGKRRLPWTQLLLVSFFMGTAQMSRGEIAPKNGPTEIIGDVMILGNQKVTTEKILQTIRSRPGTPCSYRKLHEDVARLAEVGLFRNVWADKKMQADDTGEHRLVVIFKVQEFPNTIQEIIFKNAYHISEKDLHSLTRLRKGDYLDPVVNRKACWEIEDYYKNQGRFFAKVSLEEGTKIDDTRVVFHITEGPVVRVRSIQYAGEEKLTRAAGTQEDFARPFVGKKYSPDTVGQKVATKLQKYFRVQGRQNVAVTPEVRFSNDFQWVDLTFHLQERPPCQFFSITMKANGELATAVTTLENFFQGIAFPIHILPNEKEKDSLRPK